MGSKAGSRATSYKPSTRISMKSARKVSPGLMKESVYIVLDKMNNDNFTNFYKNLPYTPKVIN